MPVVYHEFSQDQSAGDAPSWPDPQTDVWTVPAGLTLVAIELCAGPGNEPTGGLNDIGTVSGGGVVRALMAVTPGDEYQTRISGMGSVSPSNSGGYGGAGVALIPKVAGSFNYTNAVAVAGGGGGNGGNNVGAGGAGVGGDGGGTTGAAGVNGKGTDFGHGGGGGTSSAGGAGGTGGGGTDGSAGILGVGGAGGSGAGIRGGGGGGGGWYGGGGGERGATTSDGGGGGGGGSSYTTGAVTNVVHQQGVWFNAPRIRILGVAASGIFVDGAVH